jgi:hypothetical protein
MPFVSGRSRLLGRLAPLLVALLVLALAEVPGAAWPVLGTCLESGSAEDEGRFDEPVEEPVASLSPSAAVGVGWEHVVWEPRPGAAEDGAPPCRQTRSPPLG